MAAAAASLDGDHASTTTCMFARPIGCWPRHSCTGEVPRMVISRELATIFWKYWPLSKVSSWPEPRSWKIRLSRSFELPAIPLAHEALQRGEGAVARAASVHRGQRCRGRGAEGEQHLLALLVLPLADPVGGGQPSRVPLGFLRDPGRDGQAGGAGPGRKFRIPHRFGQALLPVGPDHADEDGQMAVGVETLSN
jgi:hypothetical protein